MNKVLMYVIFTEDILVHVNLLMTFWWMLFLLKTFWYMLFNLGHFGACYLTKRFFVHVIFAKDILVHVF